jgi:hypothetical protein
MRNFSLISILLALVIGAIAWQKLLDHNVPDRLPDPVQYTPDIGYQDGEQGQSENCVESSHDGQECSQGEEMTEQDELQEYQQRAYGTIMKSFDGEYDKYRDQANGRP